MLRLLYYGRFAWKCFIVCFRRKVTPAVIVHANPCFEWGGLCFSSKYALLKSFPNTLPTLLLRKGDVDWAVKVRRFVDTHGFPVMLKPDRGYAGMGVQRVEGMTQLTELLQKQTWDYLVQPYDKSLCEFSFFYLRRPSRLDSPGAMSGGGSITSLIEKTIPTVKGDGVHTVEALLKRSGLSQALRKVLKSEIVGSRSRVLREGEVVALTPSASHARGAIFTDISHEIDTSFQGVIRDLLAPVEGFFWGRLDVKADSLSALKAGRFNVLEVNGAGAQFIHAWDGRYSKQQRAFIFMKQLVSLVHVAQANQKRLQLSSPSLWALAMRYLSYYLLVKQAGEKIA